MLNHIVEESLRVFPGSPVNPGSFQDQISCAREDVLELISRHLTEFGVMTPTY